MKVTTMKSTFALLAVLGLFLISLVGCKHDDATAGSNTNPTPANTKNKKIGGTEGAMQTQ